MSNDQQTPATPQITIRNRWTGAAIFTGGATIAESVRMALESGANLRRAYLSRAYLSGADLSGADLRDADLSRAYLSGADLRDADLSRAYLSGADLRDANLRRAYLSRAYLSRAYLSRAYLSGADLSGADLRDAYLSGADLSGADLSDADLSGANLSDADLSGADLRDADLSDAYLRPIRDDIWAILSSAPAEAAAVRDALAAGLVDGSTYSGACSCLVGTIATARGCNVCELDRNSARPAERFFVSIRPGHTPANSQHCALAHQWVNEWIDRMKTAFGATASTAP